MLRNLTICGAPLSAFAKHPTPKELAEAVSAMSAGEQAEFISCWGETLKLNSGDCPSPTQIGTELDNLEEQIDDGSGSGLVERIYASLCAAARAR